MSKLQNQIIVNKFFKIDCDINATFTSLRKCLVDNFYINDLYFEIVNIF
jgi:hypothetical protein